MKQWASSAVSVRANCYSHIFAQLPIAHRQILSGTYALLDPGESARLLPRRAAAADERNSLPPVL